MDITSTTKMNTVSLTKALISLPPWYVTASAMVVASLFVSVISGFMTPQQSVVVNSVFGFAFLAVPMLLGSMLTSFLSMFTKKYLMLKRSMFLGAFGLVMIFVFYFLGAFTSFVGVNKFADLLIYAYCFVFAARLFILSVTMPYSRITAFILAAVHPAIGLFSIVIASQYFYPFTVMFFYGSDAMFIAKTFISTLFLVISIIFFWFLINAPMLRNLGVSTYQLARAFLQNWNDGSMEIEKLLTKISSKSNAFAGLICFRKKGSKKPKAVIVVPGVHPGPFGIVGGGQLVKKMVNAFDEKGLNAITMHSIATHNMNPVNARSVDKLVRETVNAVPGVKYGAKMSAAVRSEALGAKFIGQRFDGSAFIASTFSPSPTEDIDTPIGLAVTSNLGKYFSNTVYGNCHNCYTIEGYHLMSGTKQAYELVEAAGKIGEKLSRQKLSEGRVGFAKDEMKMFALEEGIGPGGLRVLAIESGKQLTAYVFFDANNMVRGLREKIIKKVKELGANEAEVFTSDNHSVNSIRGVENPLGQAIPESILIQQAADAFKRAVKDLEPAEVGITRIKVTDLDLMVPNKADELVSTTNAIVGLMKIASPIIFGEAVVLSLMLTLLI